MKLSVLDIVAISFAFLFCVFSYYIFWQGNGSLDASHAVIKSTEQEQEYSLFSHRIIDVKGPLGISKIEISDGQARFLSSPCNNQMCVLAGWLKQSGDIAVCLPNGISLQTLGNERFDSINF